jgi:MIP family channel proteins
MATSLDDLRSPLFWRAILAEFIGTLVLTFIGCMSCIGWEESYTPTIVQISLAFGLSVATIVWAIGHVSGGHINPAVTAGMLVTRKISLAKGLLFIVAQSLGAVSGAALLKVITPVHARGALGATTVNDHLSPGQAMGVEALVTFVLVLTVFGSCDNKRSDLNGSAPLTIGLSVTMCHLAAIKYTGSSMNPARTLGPAVVMGIWHEHWVYWCGPILGGVVAALIYENLFAANASLTKAKDFLMTTAYDSDKYGRSDAEEKDHCLKSIEADASA